MMFTYSCRWFFIVKRSVFFCLLFGVFISCVDSEKLRIAHVVNKWNGRTISFPPDLTFTILGRDTIADFLENRDYSIITYVDSTGCVSCNLQLIEWKKFINELNFCTDKIIPVLFIVHPKARKDIVALLASYNYVYPVCIDDQDAFNRLNKIPKDRDFQTFLLDREDRVIVIGNPIHNLKVKELYLSSILSDSISFSRVAFETTFGIESPIIDLGIFCWKEEQSACFKIKNTGEKPLVITDIKTSCGCVHVNYDKVPVGAGKSVDLNIIYKAEHHGYVNKTVTVYCNSNKSPVILRLKGEGIGENNY